MGKQYRRAWCMTQERACPSATAFSAAWLAVDSGREVSDDPGLWRTLEKTVGLQQG